MLNPEDFRGVVILDERNANAFIKSIGEDSIQFVKGKLSNFLYMSRNLKCMIK